MKHSKVGIFWFYNNEIIAKSEPVKNVKADSIGLIDSSFLHVEEWENNQTYLPKFPELINTEYQEFPRGRVLYDSGRGVFKIILDKSLFRKKNIAEIKNRFEINDCQVEYFSDPHYKTFHGT